MAGFFHKNLLTKFDWWPFSNIGTSPGMSECVRHTRLKKSEHGFCSLFTPFTARGCKLIFRTRGRMTCLLNFFAVLILLQGRQSNCFRIYCGKKWCQIQDLPIIKSVMVPQSWGKLRPFFSRITLDFTVIFIINLKLYLNMTYVQNKVGYQIQ